MSDGETQPPILAAVRAAIRALKACEEVSDPINGKIRRDAFLVAMERAGHERARLLSSDLTLDQARELAELGAELHANMTRIASEGPRRG